MKSHRTVLSCLLCLILSLSFSSTASADALHDAIEAGDAGQVKAMLAKDPAMAKTPDADGGMPLAAAALSGSEAIADFLLAAGADIENGGGASPLGLAAISGYLPVVKQLLAKGASPKALTAAKVSTLALASRGSVRTVTKASNGIERYSYAPNTEIAALLLAAGVSPTATDTAGQTPLHLAASHGNPGIVVQLLAAKVPVDVRTRDGLTPLHYASLTGDQVIAKDGDWHTIQYYSNAEAARLLIKAGADVNAVTTEKKLTPLMMAAARGLDDVVKVLLEAKADVNRRSVDGRTALHLAAESNRLIEKSGLGDDEKEVKVKSATPTEVIAALLKAGASRTAKDNEGKTPADLAPNYLPEIAKMLNVQGN